MNQQIDLQQLADAYCPPIDGHEWAALKREEDDAGLWPDWHRHQRELAEEHKRNKRNRLVSAIVAVAVSVLGVGMFVALALVWGM